MCHHQKYASEGFINSFACSFFWFLKRIAAVAIAVVIAIFASRGLNSLNKTHLYVQDLYVPSLVNKTTTFNTSVYVDLKFERKAALARHHYGGFQMTLSYGQYQIKSFPVGTHVVQGFNMGRKKRVHKKMAVEAVGMPWEEASRAVSGGKVVAMAVELISSHHKWDEPVLVARVAVDASGHMLSKNPIQFEEWY